MQAAVCYKFGKPLVIEEVEIDPPQSDEVRVRLAATSICSCDIHIIKGELGGGVPVVAGHEAAGIVEEMGEDVTTVQVGDPVVVSSMASCGRCAYCTNGASHLCDSEFALRTESRLRNKEGEYLRHGAMTAAFAEQVVVHQSQVVKVAAEMPLERAALLGCTVITGVGAVTNTAKVRKDTGVAVVGLGAVGLSVVMGAALVGANPIIGIDLLDTRLTVAQQLGATHLVKSTKKSELIKDTMALTGNRGLDYLFTTVATTQTIEQGFALLRKQGTEIIVGFHEIGKKAAFQIRDFVFQEKRIMGSIMGSVQFSSDVPWLVEQYQKRHLKLDELITGRYPLDQINLAIETLKDGKALRNMIIF